MVSVVGVRVEGCGGETCAPIKRAALTGSTTDRPIIFKASSIDRQDDDAEQIAPFRIVHTRHNRKIGEVQPSQAQD